MRLIWFFGLHASYTARLDSSAVSKVVEWLVDGVEHVLDVSLEETSLSVQSLGYVILDEIDIRGAQLHGGFSKALLC